MNDTEKILQNKTQYSPIQISQLGVGTTILLQADDEEVYELVILNTKRCAVHIRGGQLFKGGIDAIVTSS
ncbi:unnamed protein product, partial [marine sediment metagenome]